MKHVALTILVCLVLALPQASKCMETSDDDFPTTNQPLLGDFLEKTLHVSQSIKKKANFLHTYAVNTIPIRYGLIYGAYSLIPLSAQATLGCCITSACYDCWYWNDKEAIIDYSERKITHYLDAGKKERGVINVSFSSPRFRKIMCGYALLISLLAYGFYMDLIPHSLK